MVVSEVGKVARASAGRPVAPLAGAVAVAALAVGLALGRTQDYLPYLALGGATAVLCLLLAREDDLVAALAVAAAIFLDVYHPITLPLVGIPFPVVGASIIALALFARFARQSPGHPWTRTPYLWIWALVLLLAALAIPPSESASSALQYYVTVLLGMPLAYVLGTQLGRGGTAALRRLLVALGVLAALISIHAIIQAQFGTFLFLTPQAAQTIASQGGYVLSGTDKVRAGSFLINPDKLGNYLAVMLPMLFGLGIALQALWARVAAFAGAALVAVALLLTYSTASLIATAVGIFAVFLLVARGRARIYLPAIVLALAVVVAVLFPASVQALVGHATASSEITERVGAWETGLATIAHEPLTGVGLGYTNYWHQSNPYLSPLETEQVNDPQNSFLELAAMAGVAVALFYLLVLGLAFAAAGRNYRRAQGRERIVIGAVLVGLIVLTVNSLATPGWTYPAFGLMGWLLLGAVASPALLPPGLGADASSQRAVAVPAIEPAEMAAAATREEGA